MHGLGPAGLEHEGSLGKKYQFFNKPDTLETIEGNLLKFLLLVPLARPVFYGVPRVYGTQKLVRYISVPTLCPASGKPSADLIASQGLAPYTE
jgi:hypothetical protein